MDVDWEVEIGGGAPVIEADWPGMADLRRYPELISEVDEASAFPPLANLLIQLNSNESPVWTSKCDLWELEPGGLAVYVDLIPHDENVFSEWRRVEGVCRALVRRMAAHDELESNAAITLVVRQATTEKADGFGVTAYFSSETVSAPDAATAVSDAMVAFSNAIRGTDPLEDPDQS